MPSCVKAGDVISLPSCPHQYFCVRNAEVKDCYAGDDFSGDLFFSSFFFKHLTELLWSAHFIEQKKEKDVICNDYSNTTTTNKNNKRTMMIIIKRRRRRKMTIFEIIFQYIAEQRL